MLNYLEKNFGTPDNPLSAGTESPSFSVTLSNSQEIELKTLLQNGPVLLNFIKGTWCSFCKAHMSNILKWQNEVRKNVSVLVITNEPADVVKEWKDKSNITHLMGCDPEQIVIKKFGLELTDEEFSRPATFLIDTNGIIRLAHYTKRTPALRRKLTSELVEIEPPSDLVDFSAAQKLG